MQLQNQWVYKMHNTMIRLLVNIKDVQLWPVVAIIQSFIKNDPQQESQDKTQLRISFISLIPSTKEKYVLPKFTKYSSCGVSTDMQSAFSSIVDGTAFKPSNV